MNPLIQTWWANHFKNTETNHFKLVDKCYHKCRREFVTVSDHNFLIDHYKNMQIPG